MYDSYVIDTHALLWFFVGSGKLGAGAKAVFDDSQSSPSLPAIALAEAFWMIEHGRAGIANAADLLTHINRDRRIQVSPIDREIVELTLDTAKVGEIHDRLIVATALKFERAGRSTAIITADALITSSGLAPIVW